jgi:hypothetical protein
VSRRRQRRRLDPEGPEALAVVLDDDLAAIYPRVTAAGRRVLEVIQRGRDGNRNYATSTPFKGG